jgi:hypothetical protein
LSFAACHSTSSFSAQPSLAATSEEKRAAEKYLTEQTAKGQLRFFQNDMTRPATCMGIVLRGKVQSQLSYLADDGANVNLVTRSTAEALSIPIIRKSMALTTSNGVGTSVFGITPMLEVRYGTGANAFTSHHSFLVVDQPNNIFHVLIGNPDFIAARGVIDQTQETYTLNPEGEATVVLKTEMRH